MPHGHAMALHAGLTAVVWRVSYLIGGGGGTVYPPLGRAKKWFILTYRHVVDVQNLQGDVLCLRTQLQKRLKRCNASCPHSWFLEAAAGLLVMYCCVLLGLLMITYFTLLQLYYSIYISYINSIYHLNDSVPSPTSIFCVNISILLITKCCIKISYIFLWLSPNPINTDRAFFNLPLTSNNLPLSVNKWRHALKNSH